MDNQSKILAEKISSKLAKAGETSDVIEIDRAAHNGDANAQYEKACQLLGRQDCKLPFKNKDELLHVIGRGTNTDLNTWGVCDRLRAEGSVFSYNRPQESDWFIWLLKSVRAGHQKALEDILYLIHWPPYIQDPQLYFEVCLIASKFPDIFYLDAYGDAQPYALKVAEMYWIGRVHIPTAREVAENIDINFGSDSLHRIGRYNKGPTADETAEAFFTKQSFLNYATVIARLENDGRGYTLKSRNIIGENPLLAVEYFSKAATMGSLAAMDKLCRIMLFGGCFSESKEKVKPNTKTALGSYLKLEERGGYSTTLYSYAGNPRDGFELKNAVRSTNPCHIAGIYLYGAPGVEKNLEIAVDRYTKCVDLGYKEAESQLRHILDHIQTKKPLPPVPKGYPPEIGKNSVSNLFSRFFG